MNDLLAHLAIGFGVALSPANLLAGFIGVVLGTAVGVLPGIGPAVAISLLLPTTFGLDPATAFIMFGGIYYGSMYGGSTTSILVNTPGDASAAVTTIDGTEMTRRGRAGAALTTAAIGSFVAGTFGTAMLMLVAPALVEVSLQFGPPEYFALMLLALTAVSSLAADSRAHAATAMFIGLLIAMIGIDLQTGVPRLTFGRPELLGGIDVVLAAVGLFAIGEVLWTASTSGDQNVATGRGRTPDDDGGGMAALDPGVDSRHAGRVQCGPLAGRRRDDGHVHVLRSRALRVEAAGGIWPWRHRRRGGS